MFSIQTDYANKIAHTLGTRLVGGECNPDPREAPNPAHGVHIRRIVPACGLRPNVSQEIKEHNSRVSSVGAADAMKHLWGEFE